MALLDGEDVVIMSEGTPRVRLVAVGPLPKSRELGWADPSGLWMSDDFDLPLDDHDEPFCRGGSTMECLHCRGGMERSTARFTADRRGYQVTSEAIHGWVCTQCGEALFELAVVEAIQRALAAVDTEAARLHVTA